jgi:hypothetical protein
VSFGAHYSYRCKTASLYVPIGEDPFLGSCCTLNFVIGPWATSKYKYSDSIHPHKSMNIGQDSRIAKRMELIGNLMREDMLVREPSILCCWLNIF